MATPIRIGIIGSGLIGRQHTRRYGEIEGAEVVALADLNKDAADSVAEQYGVPDTYSDYREILKRDDIQAVDVCLHNNLHMPFTVAALEAGKDVFCEKPMAGAYVDAQKMLDTATQLGRKLSIQNNRLFQKEARAAKILIDKGHLGKIYHGRATGFRRRGRPFVDGYATPAFVKKETATGGALYDLGCYYIGQMLYLMGNPKVERISGKTYQETPMNLKRKEASGYNVEELGLGFVRMAGGLTLDLIQAWAIHADRFEGSIVYGREGGVRLEPFAFYHLVEDMAVDSTFDLDQAAYRWKMVQEIGDGYDSPLHHWVAALRGEVALLPTAEVALNTMLISEGIFLSNELGREVTAEEVREHSTSTSVTL